MRGFDDLADPTDRRVRRITLGFYRWLRNRVNVAATAAYQEGCHGGLRSYQQQPTDRGGEPEENQDGARQGQPLGVQVPQLAELVRLHACSHLVEQLAFHAGNGHSRMRRKKLQ
jgi:hypothetical protein